MQAISLTPFATITATVAPPLALGTGGFGQVRVIPITGGRVEGDCLSGEILPGGSDEQSIRADGLTRLHARYLVRTADDVLVKVDSQGLRSGPPEVMERLLAGEQVDPDAIYFMTAIRFDVTAAAYDALNRCIFIGKGRRDPDCVHIALYATG